jgi:predicted dehydrogenase
MANRTVDKAEKLSAALRIECPVFSDYREMLKKAKPDAVLINLAHHLHHRCFLDFAEAGVDIIIEKPLANTYAECLDMIDAAKRSGVKATVCHTQRYNAIYVQAAEFLVENDLGRLLSVNDNINTNYFWDGRSPWQLSRDLSGGGIALNYGVHQLDRVHYFLGQKTQELKAFYMAAKEGYDVYSSYAMMGVGDLGTPYVITGTGYSGPWLNETTLAYEKGVLRCNLLGTGAEPKGLFFGSNEAPEYRSIPIEYAEEDMYIREFSHALDYLSGAVDEPPVPLEWAAEMVRLVESSMAQ